MKRRCLIVSIVCFIAALLLFAGIARSDPPTSLNVEYDTVKILSLDMVTGKGWNNCKYVVGDTEGGVFTALCPVKTLTIRNYPNNFLMQDLTNLICSKIKVVESGDPNVWIQYAVHAGWGILLKYVEFSGKLPEQVVTATDITPFIDAEIAALKGEQFEPILSCPSTLVLGTASSGSITLQNTGGESLTWRLASVNSRITPSTSGGDIPAGGSMPLGIIVDRVGLTAGIKEANLTVQSTGGSQTCVVSVDIQPSVLDVSPLTLVFPAGTSEGSFVIRNTGEAPLTWQTVPSIGKITCVPVNSTVNGALNGNETETVVVTVNRDGISPGVYNQTITVNSNGHPPKVINVTIEVGS